MSVKEETGSARIWYMANGIQKIHFILVASDMTTFCSRGERYGRTLLIDAFNNEILSQQVSDKPGDNRPYYHVLKELNRLAGERKEQTTSVTSHTDQGF